MKNKTEKPMMILMAIVQNPIIGKARKKFANAVFSEVFGKNTIRSKPIKVKNPKTKKQVSQRTKFKLMVYESRVLLGLIRTSFQNMAVGKSAYNAFMKANIKTAIQGSLGNWSINYNNLLVAQGPLFTPLNLVSTVDLAECIKRTWTPPIDTLDPSNNDILYTVAYDSVKAEWYYGASTTLRSAGSDEQRVPINWSGDKVFVYSFFISTDGTQCSNSVCSGSVLIM